LITTSAFFKNSFKNSFAKYFSPIIHKYNYDEKRNILHFNQKKFTKISYLEIENSQTFSQNPNKPT